MSDHDHLRAEAEQILNSPDLHRLHGLAMDVLKLIEENRDLKRQVEWSSEIFRSADEHRRAPKDPA